MEPKFIELEFKRLSAEEQEERSKSFLGRMRSRRTVRDFSPAPIAPGVLKNILNTATTAPSGANLQPWRFVVVTDPEIKKRIRIEAEKEEKENYERRFPQEWKDELNQFGTDWHKPFLEIAPVLIVIFKESYRTTDDGNHEKNYYVNESVGLASGFLLAAIHNAGLVSLTHTPSPMNFLRDILGRPANEKPFLLIPVGFPADGAVVPNIRKKSFEEMVVYR